MIPQGMISELIEHGGDIFTEAERTAHKKDIILITPVIVAGSNKYVTPNIEETVTQVKNIELSGTDVVSLVSGLDTDNAFFYDCIAAVRRNTKLRISVNRGPLNKDQLMILKEIGINMVSCAFPVSDSKLFMDNTTNERYKPRILTLKVAGDLGLRTTASLIFGLSETLGDIDAGIRAVEKLRTDTLSIMNVWPALITEKPERDRLVNIGRVTAACRLCLPDETNIAISTFSRADYLWGIKCGANAFAFTQKHQADSTVSSDNEAKQLKSLWNEHSCEDINSTGVFN